MSEKTVDGKTTAIIIILIMFFSIVSFQLGSELQRDNDRVDIGKNVEYLLYSDNYPKHGLVDKLTIQELRMVYQNYNQGNNKVAKLTVAAVADRVCNSNMAPDWFNTSLSEEERENMRVLLNEVFERKFT